MNHLPNGPAYRHPGSDPKPEPPATFTLDWEDSENRTPWTTVTLSTSAVLTLAVVVGIESPAAAWIVIAGGVGWLFWRFRRSPRRPIAVRIEGPTLFITPAEGDERSAALASIREVEIDRKAIRRLTYHQQVGAAMPTTEVSGDVDVARIVFVVDGSSQPLRLSDSYASYGECIERFGKLRKFLRSHGWLPVDERVAAEE
jgi:hypothetical protein